VLPVRRLASASAVACAALVCLPTVAYAFKPLGHDVIEATAYKRLLAENQVPGTRASGKEVLAMLIRRGVLAQPSCFPDDSGRVPCSRAVNDLPGDWLPEVRSGREDLWLAGNSTAPSSASTSWQPWRLIGALDYIVHPAGWRYWSLTYHHDFSDVADDEWRVDSPSCPAPAEDGVYTVPERCLTVRALEAAAVVHDALVALYAMTTARPGGGSHERDRGGDSSVPAAVSAASFADEGRVFAGPFGVTVGWSGRLSFVWCSPVWCMMFLVLVFVATAMSAVVSRESRRERAVTLGVS